MKKILFGIAILATAVACKTTPPTPEPPVENAPAMSADVSAGKVIFNNDCAKCHSAKVIDDYTQQQWTGILRKMIIKAKLDETKASQVTQYVNWELEN